ncbi:hypothetical protein TcWFU_009875 [Taenia crassiceps]|uniref:U3 small nucleolar RNA-associated protein 18 n=1 Tax=Taenia crassiceps TaxID=6207 RepID=A0ABR4QTI2_9CEST
MTSEELSIVDPEFDLIKHPKKVFAPKNEDVLLNPAWTDDENLADRGETCALSEPAVLDIRAHLKRKRTVTDGELAASDMVTTEKLYAVFRESGRQLSDADISMCRLSDANMERLSCGPLTSAEFSPAHRIAMTASVDTTMALFSLENSESHLLADFAFEKFPISSARFTRAGDRIILTGKRKYFKVYDLNSNKESHPVVPLGTRYGEKINSVQMSPMCEIAAFSATGGIYLFDFRSFEKTTTVRVSGNAVAHCFAQGGDILNAFSNDGSVFMFDLRHNARPVHRWSDYSCTGGCSFAISDDSKYIACGSESGYVNIYTWEAVMNGSIRRPKPLKSVGNLTTAVDQLLFHPSNQLLYMSSSLQSAAARLYDLGGQQVYSNFPTCMGRLGVPTAVGFSPHGGYLAVGQASGHAALYRFDWQGSKILLHLKSD